MSSNVSRRKFLGLAGAAVGLGAAGYYGINSLTQAPAPVDQPAGLADRYTRLALPKILKIIFLMIMLILLDGSNQFLTNLPELV